MIKFKNAILFLPALFCFQSFFAQETAPTKYFYSSYDEKPSGKLTSAYIVAVFNQAAETGLWRREVYYNQKSRPIAARGFSKDSSGLVRHGAFEYFHQNGKKWKQGKYNDNEQEGAWEEWDDKGNITGKLNYHKGHMTGLNLKWFNSTISDSIILDENGSGKAIGFFTDGKISYKGNYINGRKENEWIYYFPTPSNNKSMVAQLVKDSAVSFTCFNEEGEQQQKDCVYEKEANFPGDMEAWKEYLVRSLGKIKSGKYLPGGGRYSLMIRFIVSKTGDVTDASIEEPGNIPELNVAALKIISNSPKWIPAIQYNRKVNAYRRQPLTFAVD
jgi:antitoxin component YwqK of YwqJK toxin-antitoxin module